MYKVIKFVDLKDLLDEYGSYIETGDKYTDANIKHDIEEIDIESVEIETIDWNLDIELIGDDYLMIGISTDCVLQFDCIGINNDNIKENMYIGKILNYIYPIHVYINDIYYERGLKYKTNRISLCMSNHPQQAFIMLNIKIDGNSRNWFYLSPKIFRIHGQVHLINGEELNIKNLYIDSNIVKYIKNKLQKIVE
jgi:hypothetical protein